MNKRKKNLANEIDLTAGFLETSGQPSPTPAPAVTKTTTEGKGTHFSVICNSEIVEKVKNIAKLEGFTIREVVEKYLSDGIKNYETKRGPVTFSENNKDINDVL